jgi:Rieske Fe-S protein
MKKILFGFTALFALALFSCKDDTPNTNNYIPSGPVSLVINTDLPEYYKLKTPGTHVYQPGGNRGVIVIHNFDDTYLAIERTCSIDPDKACSFIYVDSTKLNLRCGTYNINKWEPCCDSRFMYSGWVQQGPAQYPLRTYNATLSGSVITVRN